MKSNKSDAFRNEEILCWKYLNDSIVCLFGTRDLSIGRLTKSLPVLKQGKTVKVFVDIP